MKKLLLTSCILFTMLYSKAQNLVPNPSFETHTTCTGILEFKYYGTSSNIIPPWYCPNHSTPDYFNSCATSLVYRTPSNSFGYQQPRTGNAYAGILAYFYDNIQLNYREYIGVKLTDSLITGNKYCISFYVSVTPYLNSSYTRSYSISQIGLYISDTVVKLTNLLQNYFNLAYEPQIKSPVGFYLSDTLNWIQISGEYTSHGGEKYITIGNFYDDNHTDTLFMATNNLSGRYTAYYYIDDVSVIDCTGVGVNELEKGGVNIYPNPTTKELRIKSEELRIESVSIYNVLGELVNSQQGIGNSKVEVDVNELPSGIYFVEVQTEKGVERKKFIKE